MASHGGKKKIPKKKKKVEKHNIFPNIKLDKG